MMTTEPQHETPRAAAAPQPAQGDLLTQLRALAKQRYPLGEIARRLGKPAWLVREIADRHKILFVRDDRLGGPRVVLASHMGPAGYAAQLRAGWRIAMAHKCRIAAAPELTQQQEQEAIERFLQTKSVTQCPTVHLEGSVEGPASSKTRIKGSLQVEP